ncbi:MULTISPECIES: CBS domain-containing protein [unclassified Polaribacter]|uniref:CBS domain-containing protein n=1 Tax=unclassified Polaribacter TaxID=196858 RepID=UPI0011BF9069|nr:MULTISPECIES: CBS domain-containing protein [unclassified Polaribacter]TXD52948.1 magnesium transporter [Polaribacter sp. IC063]TXD60961.1 magnesium transporter [Polaribacter sp. IC066]
MTNNQTILNDFISKQPFAAAQTLERLSSKAVADFIQTVSLAKCVCLLSLMNARKAADCFVFLPIKKTTEIIEKGEVHFITAVLMLLENTVQESLLAKVSKEKKAILKLKMDHEPNSVGALMETVLSVNKEMSVREAVQIVKRNSEKEDFYLYVVDLEGNFEGIVRLKELLLAKKNASLEDLMISKILKLSPEIPIKSILNYNSWLEYHHIPVVDKFEKLLGALAYKRSIEFTEDISNSSNEKVMETGSALGELYRIGLTGILKSVSN